MISKSGFVNLNVVRALSGFVVVVAHFFQLFVMPVAGRGLVTNIAVRAAEPAVFTFFLLSGLLIALSIQKNIEKHGYFEWKSYFLARFARIYPALVVSTLMCVALHSLLAWLGHSGSNWLPRPSDVYPSSRTDFEVPWIEVKYTLLQSYAFGPGTYLTVNGPLWSLSYEIGFYLAAGFLMATLRGRGLARIAGVVGLAGLCHLAVTSQRYMFLHYGTLWVLGVSLFFLLCNPRIGYLVLTFLPCVAINVYFVASELEGKFARNFVSGLALVAMLYFLSRARATVLGPLAKMADSTYTLYLFHFPLLLFFYALIRNTHDRSAALYFAATTAFTLAVVVACWTLAKFLENRRWWESVLTLGRVK